MYTNPIESDLNRGTYHHLYLLYGDEPYLKRTYKHKLVRKLVRPDDQMNFSHYQGKDVDEKAIMDQADTLPFFADFRVILIEDSNFFKNKHDAFADYIKKGIPETTIFIFVESAVDKRNSCFKAIVKSEDCQPVLFETLKERDLMTWIGNRLKKAGKKMRRQAWEDFHTRTGESMDQMDTEFEKLLSYVGDRPEITVEDVDSICAGQAEAKVFDMISAISEKNADKVMSYYQGLLESKEDPLGILALIERQFRQLLLAKEMEAEHYDNAAISKTSGMYPYYVSKNLNLARRFQVRDIKSLLRDAADLEERAKTGRVNPRLAVEVLMMTYCR
ncbi:MAG: DNA polymerase III subunit delta [Lachnospiraceae bacterium]|nr:DNA polymerase III subunit delta [Lachnospiraceae bacterium]